MRIEKITLPNGLRVVHHHNPSTAMVALNILYNVGARDENPGQTGIAHLFEHLMFGGSVNVNNFDDELQAAGGENNAWTSNDFTNFYDIVPAQNVETAFRLESDRMLSPKLSQEAIDTQKSVVIEEFKQTCLNQPYGDLMHHLRGLAFKVHPYKTPVIGKDISHIESVSREDASEFFHKNYCPNNAVLAITGNISAERAFALAEKWFGDLPSIYREPRNLPEEPAPTSPRFLEVRGNVPAIKLNICFPMGGYTSADYRTADLLTDVLASGRASRFYRQLLMQTGLFASVDASILGSEDPGLLMVRATPADNSAKTLVKAEKAIYTELNRVVTDGITSEELTRAINRMVSTTTFANIGYLDVAQTISLAEMHGEHPDDNLKAYKNITVDDVNRAAARILDPQKASTLVYLPK